MWSHSWVSPAAENVFWLCHGIWVIVWIFEKLDGVHIWGPFSSVPWLTEGQDNPDFSYSFNLPWEAERNISNPLRSNDTSAGTRLNRLQWLPLLGFTTSSLHWEHAGWLGMASVSSPHLPREENWDMRGHFRHLSYTTPSQGNHQKVQHSETLNHLLDPFSYFYPVHYRYH